MKKFLSLTTLILFFVVACEENQPKKEVKRAEINFTKDAELHLISTAKKDTIQLDIELADTPYKQETGLMYREKMNPLEGMLFVYKNERVRPNFYMKNTLISLDLIYFDADMKVVDINEKTIPEDETSIPSDQKSMYVLEVNAGFVEQHQIEIGDSAQLIQ
ncbi:MAG: DUF192 domain-containing protein [Bacteroidota bacterium]